MTTVAPYIAVIAQVREVVLLGRADLAFWQRQLAPAGLAPTPDRGRAQLILSAPDLRWSGVRFRELSLGVVVGAPPAGGPTTGLYLAQAYNSSRLLAFLERALFQTPYARQPVQVDVDLPAAFAVRDGAGAGLRAAMGPSATQLWSRDDSWEGPIILPAPAGAPRWFRAKIGGPTRAYRFDPSADTFVVRPPAGDRLLRLLADSQFTPEEWRLRTGATHARSRTYRGPVAW